MGIQDSVALAQDDRFVMSILLDEYADQDRFVADGLL